MQNFADSISSDLGNAFARMIREGQNFRDSMKQMFSDIGSHVVNVLSQMIAKWMVFNAISFATGGSSIAFTKIMGFASGGYTGDGGKYDPAGLVHKGEFVINKEKTTIFRPLLELINYAPLKEIHSSLLNTKPFPRLPAIPKSLYSSGGYVAQNDSFSNTLLNSNHADINILSNKLDILINGINNLNSKDYNVQVQTKFKGVEFAKEMNKANAEYKRRKM